MIKAGQPGAHCCRIIDRRKQCQTAIKDYLEEQKLTSDRGGSTERLSASQADELVIHLEKHLYQHNHQIVASIKERFGIDYTVSGLHKWLYRHGFVYKQPKGVVLVY